MEIRKQAPHPALRGIVRSFGERRASLGSHELTWPLAARPHQIIDIYLRDPFRLRLDDGRALQTAPQIVVVGPQGSRRIQLYLSGEIHVFNILFQPTGLHRLFGVDMRMLINEGIPAGDVLGKSAAELNDAVRLAPDFSSRVAAAERWFGRMLERADAENGIDHVSRLLLSAKGRARIDSLVEKSGLSARQFQRRFATETGLSPKVYARTIKFDTALMAHRDHPEKPWTEIVHDAGYFDQAHFVRECHALAGCSPRHFSGDWDNIFFPVHG
jgi:AraC-like DNA-binding protein